MDKELIFKAVKYPERNVKTLHDLYLDYFNNFISLEGFANYYNIDIETANELLELGQAINWDSELRGSV